MKRMGPIGPIGPIPKYWRSLEELAATPGFEECLHREFPQGASEWTNELQRRDFLRLMGWSGRLHQTAD
jgi:MoCo/4Fe-4S cofactor protein with predicted Tat translocation signal